MYYDENIGKEKKNCEYKVFNFNPLIISKEDAIKYLCNGKFVFNKSVIETLKNYLEIYLPKYICSYYHPKSNLTIGYLYFGIGDDGSVSGIPYEKLLPKNFINYQINKIFSKLLKFTDINVKNEVKSSIKIDLIQIDKSDILENKIKNKYSIYYEYIDELEKIKLEHLKYKKKRIVWEKLYDPDILKLCEMINDQETRRIILEFIKEKTNYSIKNFKNKYSDLHLYCDVDNYWNFIYKLKSGIKFKPLKSGEIVDIKEDSLNIYYWTTKWKDSKTNFLKLAKPRLPKKSIDSDRPLFLLSQSTKMIPEWIKKNINLNLFVIKITISIKNSYVIEYKDIENKWKSSYRTVKKNGEPMSLTFKSIICY